MLTQLDDMTLIRYGTRYRTRYLLEQSRYTLTLAHSEQPPLDLPLNYLSRVEEAIARVEATRDDKELAAVESKLATVRQNDFFQEGKDWRRKVTTRTHRAARMGVSVPQELLVIGRADTVPKLLESMGTMLRLLQEFGPQLACAGEVGPLITQGRKIHDALASADADQEHKRLAELPGRVRALYRDRGELYIALKIINDAGRERHLHDPHRSSRYNLTVLRRRGIAPKERTEADPVEPS